MKTRWIVAAVLAAAILGICGLMASILIFTVGPLLRNGSLDLNLGAAKAAYEETRSQTFTFQGPAVLDLTNIAGNIEITAPLTGTASTHEIRVHYKKTAWGASEADARQRAQAVVVELKPEGERLTVQVRDPQQGGLRINERSTTVDFTIQVPADTRLTAQSRLGHVSLSGTTGQASLSSDFGNLEVQQVRGSLSLVSKNGQLNVRQVGRPADDSRDRHEINLQTDFGEIQLEAVSAYQITAKSKNGTLHLKDVNCQGEVSLTSTFGELVYEGGQAAALTATTDNGQVTFNNLQINGPLVVHSQFGALQLTHTSATAYELRTDNGDIRVDRVSGKIKAVTEFGNINLSDGQEALLDLQTKNGKVTYRGSLGQGPQRLETQFGDILVSLPAQVACDIDLQTEFGKIQSDFDVHSSGTPNEKHWQGRIGTGGPLLTVTTHNGSIRLKVNQ